MKLIFTFLILSITVTNTFAQSRKTAGLLNEINGLYEVDDSGNITYVRVFDNLNLTENEIFDRENSYFVYKYNDGNSVIQEKNEEAGRLIGKGIFPNVHIGSGLVTRAFSVFHILRVDIKENRCRVLLSLTNYKITSTDMNGFVSTADQPISGTFPFNPSAGEKNFYGQAFYNSHFAAINTFIEFERVLREGATFSGLDDDW